MQTAANGATEFSAPLYHVSASVTTGTPAQTASQAGQVSIVFVPGSTTIAALRWALTAVTVSHPDECVYDFMHGSTTGTAAASSSTIGEVLPAIGTTLANPAGDSILMLAPNRARARTKSTTPSFSTRWAIRSGCKPLCRTHRLRRRRYRLAFSSRVSIPHRQLHYGEFMYYEQRRRLDHAFVHEWIGRVVHDHSKCFGHNL